MNVYLPSWKECNESKDMNLSTPLETFIQRYEPLTLEDAAIWRKDLLEALEHVVDTAGIEPPMPVDEDQIPLMLSDEQDE